MTSASVPVPVPAPARRSLAAELPLLLVVSVALTLLVRAFVVQPFYIPSGSMENTLAVDDRVVVNKLSYRFGEISRGDVVVFDGTGIFTEAPAAASTGALPVRVLRAVGAPLGRTPGRGRDYVKRVLGIGGDRVACCDDTGRVRVNGVALDEDLYLFPGDAPSAVSFDVVVPPGHLWLMGDHRGSSGDSRSLLGRPGGGMVPQERVRGRAFAVVWPLADARRIERPEEFEQVGIPEPAGVR